MSLPSSKVYCPGNVGKLIEGPMQDGVSWAPILDEVNEWVQVGSGLEECAPYSGIHEEKPAWGKTGEDNEEITRHLMCCIGKPLVDDDEDTSTASNKPDSSAPAVALPETPDSKLSDADLDDWYLKQITKTYNPIWYEWTGSTYQEGIAFCYSKNHKSLCSYGVYCPKGPTGTIIHNGAYNDGESWAPTGDHLNQFVQVGADDQCNRYSAMKPGKTGHIMCCNDVSLDLPDISGQNQGGSASALDNISASKGLTELEQEVKDTLNPYWFDSSMGWTGTTHADAEAFCEKLSAGNNGETFHLCPVQAYCANGPNPTTEKPLYLHMDAFSGEQWAPVSLSDNAWIMIGQMSETNPQTCATHLQIYHTPPSWGLDGTRPEIKQHLLCCQDKSVSSGVIKSELESSQPAALAETTTTSTATMTTTTTVTTRKPDEGASQTSIQGMPSSVIDASSHTGSGNSSPHTGNGNNLEENIVATLQPVWYDASEGWNGGSYNDAVIFCSTKRRDVTSTTNMQLCPYSAYCPQGSSHPALGGYVIRLFDVCLRLCHAVVLISSTLLSMHTYEEPE